MTIENEAKKIDDSIAAAKGKMSAAVAKYEWYLVGAVVLLIGICVALALR